MFTAGKRIMPGKIEKVVTTQVSMRRRIDVIDAAQAAVVLQSPNVVGSSGPGQGAVGHARPPSCPQHNGQKFLAALISGRRHVHSCKRANCNMGTIRRGRGRFLSSCFPCLTSTAFHHHDTQIAIEPCPEAAATGDAGEDPADHTLQSWADVAHRWTARQLQRKTVRDRAA